MQSTFRKTLSKEKALQKIRHYCDYQERCHREVKQKLYSFGIGKKEAEEILSQMVEENYLNEERFAIAFAGGKFRMKQWGRVKIKYELKQKKVSEYCIKKAMKEIDEGDYKKTLHKLAETKWKTLKSGENIFIKKGKLQDYLLRKGYEIGLINEALETLQQKE